MLLKGPSKSQRAKVVTLKETFKAEPIHLAPILASLLFGLLCAYAIIESQIDFYQVTPFPEGIGSLGNGLYFVILAGVGASLLYLLLKRKSFKLVSLITGLALTVAVFMLSTVYLYAVFSTCSFPYADVVILILSISVTVLADFIVFRTRGRASGLVVLLLGGALGAFLGMTIPTESAILILGFLAVYDIFAVYRGPVGKIAQGGLEQLRGLSISFKDVQMGLGDLTFYSMLISRVLADVGPTYCLGSTAGVLIGVFLAFKMLEKKGMFPGLPLSIALGLVPLIISLFL
jgi:presenilin-like A22 family membrane protease